MIYLSLGTNLGDKRKNLEEAIAHLKGFCQIVRCSSVIETEPCGFVSDNRFLNMCVAVTSELSPLELLDATQEVERIMGRKTKSVNGEYHDRIIDIDIIEYNDVRMKTPRLTLPHPRAYERDFVTIPLNEIKL